jgi:hypothetical protein
MYCSVPCTAAKLEEISREKEGATVLIANDRVGITI